MAVELGTQPEFSGVFAKLIPNNSEARRLFSKAVTYMEQKGDNFHLKFVAYAGSEGAKGETVVVEPIESDTDYDTPNTSQIQREQSPDHLVLSLRDDGLPRTLQLGWRAGRGTSKIEERNVEFLLAAPRDPNSKYLAHIHMYFRFNRKSGMLMLVAGSAKEPVYYNIAGVWKELAYPSEKLLHQTTTLLRLGPFEYELAYTIQEHERNRFFEYRNAFLEKMSPTSALPPASMWKLHLDQYTLIRRFLVFETTGSGAFGWVNRAVDTDTGDPVVLKELRITNKSESDGFVHEVAMGEGFEGQKGLLPVLSSWCEHGHSGPCGTFPEKGYICMPLAQTDFTRPIWTYPGLSQKVKMRLLKNTLEGISSLHKKGIMHRDITRKNMLILSTLPPEAVLCDYGKATSEPEPKSTLLGPIRTLAPEVWNGAGYSSKIDLWAWAYAVAEVLGYSCKSNHKITVERTGNILTTLERYGEKAPDNQPLISLLHQLLAWDPKNRLSADEALAHYCWNNLDEESAEESANEFTDARKRIRLI